MKHMLFGITAVLCMGYHMGYAQTGNCSTITGDITQNNYVCGDTYGDANGNSIWDWTITPDNDPTNIYCNLWYARTSSTTTLLTAMGSPFINATTGKLYTIAQGKDYTRDKGWELLQRNFGCQVATNYPYFVLYNRYSGLMRIYIFQNETQPYSSMAIKISPATTIYPATTASGDSIETAPDKFLTSSSSGTFGKNILAVSDNIGGGNRWLVVEFNPSFDPNIANAVYAGAGLQFTIFGVQNYALQATINGTAVPNGSGVNFAPKTPPATGGSSILSVNTQEFTTFATDLNGVKSSINSLATGISTFLSAADPKSVEGRTKKSADTAVLQTAQTSSAVTEFASIFGDAANILTGGTNVLKLAGDIVGLLSGGSGTKTPASAPTYTINLTLSGSLTLDDVAETFILQVPGAVSVDNNDLTYYQCPLGIFNLVNTPKADTVMYQRLTSGIFTLTPFVAYKMTDDIIPVSYFDGTGLDLVSVQAAIMGKALPGSNGVASYNALAPSLSGSTYNFLRPDFEAGRLEVTFYDVTAAHEHLFQTPYVNLECLKGMSINVPATTNVFLRVKAILKRKDDPDNTPIIYIEDYKISPSQGAPLDPNYRFSMIALGGNTVLPPYANYTVAPSFVSDRVYTSFSALDIANGLTIEADNSITAGTNVTIDQSVQGVVFEAGNAVYLEPGFQTTTGISFTATVDNYGLITPPCGTPQRQAFQSSGNCFNTTAAGLAKKPGLATASGSLFDNNTADSAQGINFYPIPARESLTITGLQGWGQSTIVVLDQSGRQLFTVNKEDDSPTLQLNVAGLANGVYFLEIQGDTKKLTHKFVVAH